ncbi:hypothetical protein [Pedobacter sp. UYP30]|uniref:hypothetical protein n=1 Tax=Pedobacter sp. UYP30 TaxID=1756400 RepID=UPI0033972BBA
MKIGNLNINLVKYSFKPNGVRFLVVHDNEDTGVKAAFEYIRWSGGELIDSQYGSIRNYNFMYMDDAYHIDPNAIYTDIGVKTRLKMDPNSSVEVADKIIAAGKQILSFYDAARTGYILTLHNNSDGAFGIKSYATEGELASTTDSLYISPHWDPDDMLLVTKVALFNYLKKADVNVVLQSKFAENDGSLSIYGTLNNIPYINVEVQHGHQYEHLQLIEYALAALKSQNLIKPN